ncbi:hypothetical protein QYE76_049353 [Lolium multiflorum]|uniref:RNase H type-1 domain-containing protein n=1 Tax=Lolium multiflorum TaxID=4521 RepID=A0AAD8WG96_LOLMU|nr:hypothetical protein QYE76_049353 [Lolium multiflorum]
MRSCCSPSSLRGISRAAWSSGVAAAPSLTGGSHHQQQRDLRYLPLPPRPPAPPIPHGLAERFFSSSSTKKPATTKDIPVDSASGADPFYVVRKGDVIGIYKNLPDCQAQVSNSVCDPSMTVYKGYSLRKETEEYLPARGLKNALYSINAADAKDELFDDLALCPFQVLALLLVYFSINFLVDCSLCRFSFQQPDGSATATQEMLSCILEFAAARKGNPSKSGAGVILRRQDGSVIAQLREGLGSVTDKTAEYRALLLGLRYAVNKGFKYIRAQGNSQSVCYQVQGLWHPKRDHTVDLCKKVKELKGRFLQIQMNLVLREFNADAHAQAKLAIKLPVGGIHEESTITC